METINGVREEVEGRDFFSTLKRVVGEVIRARKMKYRIHEDVMKIYYYFLIRKNTVVNRMVHIVELLNELISFQF